VSYRPYIFWTKAELASHLKNVASTLSMPKTVKDLIEEAITSDLWDPTIDYDGCTAVQDVYHPCVSCFIHDYLWITGQGGKESDELFYYLMREERTPESKAIRRYWAVRLGWVFYYKWKNFKKRNVNPYSKNFLWALDDLRIKYING
jgi:hypothetical protein